MKLSLKNIGKIRNAAVELNGITVIAGENNTGKSTVGKVLYSVFNSFYNIEQQIQKERIQSVDKILDIMYSDLTDRMYIMEAPEGIDKDILKAWGNAEDNQEALKNKIIKIIVQYDKEFQEYLNDAKFQKYVEQICSLLQVSNAEIFRNVLNKKLDVEFNGQLSSFFTKDVGLISIQIKEKTMRIQVQDDSVVQVDNQIALRTEAIYVDDPFVIDDMRFLGRVYRSTYLNHRAHLQNKLSVKSENTNIIEEIVTTNKFEKIYKKINSVCGGDIVTTNQKGLGYKKKNSTKVLDVKNLSTGLKTFVILKQLLVNGALELNGTIILDEPEIHLHPEWQLLFAELIVLLQKEFGMHILLNTHSPYFLNAIEVYAAKYGIADKCKYYMTEEKGEYSDIADVTNDIEKIYAKLARPLQRLENERYMND